MASCELCGKDSTSLISVKVAGSVMKACPSCKSMGVPVYDAKGMSHTFVTKRRVSGPEEVVVSNFSQLVRAQMSKRNINDKQLAMATNTKDSTLSKYLSGKISPDIETAKKLERFLGITLVKVEENSMDYQALDDNTGGFTLGDLIKKNK